MIWMMIWLMIEWDDDWDDDDDVDDATGTNSACGNVPLGRAEQTGSLSTQLVRELGEDARHDLRCRCRPQYNVKKLRIRCSQSEADAAREYQNAQRAV